MSEKLKLVAVSYLNTKPFLAGLRKGGVSQNLEISEETPALCAEQLINGKADIGLVPVAAIPFIPNAKIISDYCIGCDGAVGTVKLFSNQPIESLDTIILDYQSRTSVQLLKILVKDFWGKTVVYLNGEPGFENTAQKNQGVLVIGDRAMDLDKVYDYQYDLGAIWKEHTGLPFVFATWVCTKPVNESFVHSFNEGLAQGLDSIPEIIEAMDERPHFSLAQYYRNLLSFEFNESKYEALERFMFKLGYQLVEGGVRPLETDEV